MDFLAQFSQFPLFQPQNRLALVLGSCGMILFVVGLIWSVSSFSQPSEVEFISSASNAAEAKATSSAVVVVDVEGAVEKPGVYSLRQNGRVQDALIAAGGLSVDADRAWISRSLNMAAKVADGGKLYIPKEGENIKSSTSSVSSGSNMGSIGSALININEASSSELDKLPGVGAVTSQKIIDNRPYSSIDELLTKKVVGAKVFEQIKEKVSVN